MSGYFQFVRASPRFLAFGFTLTFFSSFGQTFLISLFGADLRAAFDLTHGEFGLRYSLATLTSGLLLMWLGRLVDVFDLRRFAVGVCVALTGAALFFSTVGSAAALTLGLFLLRFTGQGLMSHTSLTSMARYFDTGRGKALSLAMLGFPAGEFVFPLTVVAVNARFGWRATWLGIGVALAVVLVPWVLWLLRGHVERHRAWRAGLAREEASRVSATAPRAWRRRDVARHGSFWLALPGILAPMFILTGLFFHQVHVVEQKGWTLSWMAACFTGFSLTHVAGSLGAGPLVDRLGAPRLLPFFLLPLAAGLAALAAAGNHPAVAAAYLVPSGLTAGAGGTIAGALWAEAYGTVHLGAIRAMTGAIMVLSTAASPVMLGRLFDRGVTVEQVAAGCLVYVAAGAVLAATAYRKGTRPGAG